METSEFKKIYLLINIPLILICFILFVMPFFIIGKRTEIYYIGIIFRATLGIWCIFNGIWNAFTDYYSILKNNRFQKNNDTPKWKWLVLLFLGIGCIITAYMGYGFNSITKPI